ncbi:unnamed protein product [Trichogramma brassicae]|uniref:Uncharacterized protein n=1 Tax=Trichogramma brassicae TaxID=86971 RepID=A0A6H5J413_9HYME|nr:unnamed protein product [Trichogramma brassicae]
MIFIMTRSMTRRRATGGDTTLGGSSKSRLVVARLAAAPAAAAAAQHQVSTSSFQRFQRFQAQSSRCLVRVVSLGPTAPKQCVWTCTKNAIGCWLCRPHSESERRAEGHVDASNAYGLVLFVRRALTGGVGCEDTDRRSSSSAT